MKRLFIALLSAIPVIVSAGTQDCGAVSIQKVLAGPRHGAMMNVSNSSCGNNGWVCLDPNGEHMSVEESERLFSFVLSNHMANRQVRLTVYDDVFAVACGSYPVVEDIRTP